PRSRPGRDPGAEDRLPQRARRGARGRPRRRAGPGPRGAGRRGPDDRRLRRHGADGAGRLRAPGRERRGDRPAQPQAARRGDAAALDLEDRPRADRAGGAPHLRLRRRGRGAGGREGHLRPARAGAARHGLRRALPVLVDRGRLPALRGSRRGRRAAPADLLMAYTFRLPDLGEGVAEGEIARWLVEVGQEVAEDDPLVEIETDKTTVEIPSPVAGVVSGILVDAGSVVPIGTALVEIGGDGAPV